MARPKKNSNSNSTAAVGFEQELWIAAGLGGDRLRDDSRWQYGASPATDRSACP